MLAGVLLSKSYLSFKGSEPHRTLLLLVLLLTFVSIYQLCQLFTYVIFPSRFYTILLFTAEDTEVQSSNLPEVTPRKQQRQISKLQEPDSKPHADACIAAASRLVQKMFGARQSCF